MNDHEILKQADESKETIQEIDVKLAKTTVKTSTVCSKSCVPTKETVKCGPIEMSLQMKSNTLGFDLIFKLM